MKDIIIEALCKRIEEKDRYIKRLEDALIIYRSISEERKKENAGQTA